MIVYSKGEKAALQSSFLLSVCPARHLEGQELPAEWVTDKNEPIDFNIEFVYGRAEVEENLGRYLVKHGFAACTRLILPKTAMA
jgi:hypothetical protein